MPTSHQPSNSREALSITKSAEQEDYSPNNVFIFQNMDQSTHPQVKSPRPQSRSSIAQAEHSHNSTPPTSPMKNVLIEDGSLKKAEDAPLTITSIISHTPSIADNDFKDEELQIQADQQDQEDHEVVGQTVNLIPSLEYVDADDETTNSIKPSLDLQLKNSAANNLFGFSNHSVPENQASELRYENPKKALELVLSESNSKREKEPESPLMEKLSPSRLYLRSFSTIKKDKKKNSLEVGVFEADLSIPDLNTNVNVQGQSRRRMLDSFESKRDGEINISPGKAKFTATATDGSQPELGTHSMSKCAPTRRVASMAEIFPEESKITKKAHLLSKQSFHRKQRSMMDGGQKLLVHFANQGPEDFNLKKKKAKTRRRSTEIKTSRIFMSKIYRNHVPESGELIVEKLSSFRSQENEKRAEDTKNLELVDLEVNSVARGYSSDSQIQYSSTKEPE